MLLSRLGWLVHPLPRLCGFPRNSDLPATLACCIRHRCLLFCGCCRTPPPPMRLERAGCAAHPLDHTILPMPASGRAPLGLRADEKIHCEQVPLLVPPPRGTRFAPGSLSLPSELSALVAQKAPPLLFLLAPPGSTLGSLAGGGHLSPTASTSLCFPLVICPTCFALGWEMGKK